MVIADPIFYKVIETMAADLKAIKEQLASNPDKLRPLCDIINVSAPAARKRLDRDPALKGMGVAMPNGQLFFVPDQVVAYFKMRTKNGGR